MLNTTDNIGFNKLLVFLTHRHERSLYFTDHLLEFAVDFEDLLIQTYVVLRELVDSFDECQVGTVICGLKLLFIGFGGFEVSHDLLYSSQPVLELFDGFNFTDLLLHKFFDQPAQLFPSVAVFFKCFHA
jgi:hypothetical protein